MNKYKVYLKEEITTEYVVYAKNKDEAREKIRNKWDEGEAGVYDPNFREKVSYGDFLYTDAYLSD